MFNPSSGEHTAAAAQSGAGVPALGQGTANLQTGANFFSTVLNGNKANTAALLQPDINRIRESTQGALQSASTLMPRGGGRFATLFQQPFAAQRQINDLFSGVRAGAAGNLAGIGGQQAQIGTANAQNLFENAMAQRQYHDAMMAKLGQGIFGLATTPFGGGTATGGLLGAIPAIGSAG